MLPKSITGRRESTVMSFPYTSTVNPSYAGSIPSGSDPASSAVAHEVSQVRQKGAPRTDFARHLHRLFDVEVRRVHAPAPERVQHQHVDPVEDLTRRRRNPLRVRHIPQPPHAHPEGVDRTVGHPKRHHLGPQHLHRHPLRIALQRDLRSRRPLRRAKLRVEDVRETGLHLTHQLVRQVGGDRSPVSGRKDPHVVDAVYMVGVQVRVPHRAHPADARRQQLQPQLGRGVDEQVAAFQREERTVTGAPVPRVVGGAVGAVAADHRHADRGPRSQEGESQATTARCAWCSSNPDCEREGPR